MSAAAATLKEQKEAFVTGHTGTTPQEILLVCLSAPIGIFVFNEIRFLLLSQTRRIAAGKPRVVAKARFVAVESFVLLLPMAICQTRLLYPWGVAVLCLETIVGTCLHIFRRTSMRSIDSENQVVEEGPTKSHLPFLTSYRSTVSYLTFVAILAVDFHVFPRRFAKTETVGYGLMDLGAGSFVVSGGFVSWYARRKPSKQPGGGGESEGERKTYFGVLKPVLIRCCPLLLLGIIRLATNKGLEYQEHVSEYGVHWNFFFTLAAVSVLSSMIRFDGIESFGDNFIQKALPVFILVAHQTALTMYGMQEYIEEGPRRCEQHSGAICNFFAANREGVLGSVGYLCMHLLSEDIANYCLWRYPSPVPGADKRKGEVVRGQRLFASCAALWGLHSFLSTALEIPVSRRSTNATFVCWTLAHNMTILSLIWAAFYVSEASATTATKPTVSPIFDAVNRHGLIVFILANLMTGLVNLTMNTLEVPDPEALGVIFAYLFAVGALALLIDWGLSRRIKQD